MNAGPFGVGPINAPPISEMPCSKKLRSRSCVKTPGLTMRSAIRNLQYYLFLRGKYTGIDV